MVAEATSCCWPATVAEVEKTDLLALAAVVAVGKTDSTVEQGAPALGPLQPQRGLVALEDGTPEPMVAWTAFSGACNQLVAVGCSMAAAAALVEPLLQQVPAAVAEQLEELLVAAAGLDWVLVKLVVAREFAR